MNIHLILALIGLVMQLIGLVTSVKLVSFVNVKRLKWLRYALITLVSLFILANSYYALHLLLNQQIYTINSTYGALSLLFFLGGLFVVLALYLPLITLRSLSKEKKEKEKALQKVEKERKEVEKKIHQRTKELTKLNDKMVGRELKMIELKEEINKLTQK